MKKSFPCATCNANCCASYSVVITPFDALDISKALEINFEDFLTVEETDNENYYFRLADNKKCTLRLRARENFECIFLLKINGHNRCGIHAIRPYVCRCYPYNLDQITNVPFFMENVLCPSGWDISEEQINNFRKDLISFNDRWKKTYDFYNSWNESESEKSWENFIEYLTFSDSDNSIPVDTK